MIKQGAYYETALNQPLKQHQTYADRNTQRGASSAPIQLTSIQILRNAIKPRFIAVATVDYWQNRINTKVLTDCCCFYNFFIFALVWFRSLCLFKSCSKDSFFHLLLVSLYLILLDSLFLLIHDGFHDNLLRLGGRVRRRSSKSVVAGEYCLNPKTYSSGIEWMGINQLMSAAVEVLSVVVVVVIVVVVVSMLVVMAAVAVMAVLFVGLVAVGRITVSFAARVTLWLLFLLFQCLFGFMTIHGGLWCLGFGAAQSVFLPSFLRLAIHESTSLLTLL